MFPVRWRAAGVGWWVASTLAAAVVLLTVHTGLPFMVRVVLVAGLTTIPGLAVSRLLVRRSFPSMRGVWWLWLYGLRAFFVYGYLAAGILMARRVAGRPGGTAEWGTTRVLSIVFGAVAVVLWGLVVHDTLRHGLGGRDRSEVAIDVAMGVVALSGPVALVVRSVVDVPARDVLAGLAVLRPVDAAFGIAARSSGARCSSACWRRRRACGPGRWTGSTWWRRWWPWGRHPWWPCCRRWLPTVRCCG